ncbi:helix-hairpin-helix domain-containing protein [Salinicoccus kekensis]|uniref:Helix-hairpin-helix protein n=1 Tax=Salinicoccus kekensis TaxID=714307 RepID=A0A285UIQ3_9STAP|nr:helix-hairpin-helix domain-containing protein [Salinicoccus kekensis]SOC41653.1 helix-hairpin-helix protein [Salinicoccus kekensis]
MTSLPRIGKPAANALKNIGVTSLEQLSRVDKESLSRVHGIGPKAISTLEVELEREGLAFRKHEPLPFTPGFIVFGSLDCNNAPKREIIRDFAISYVEGNKYGFVMTCDEDMSLNILPAQELQGMQEIHQHLLKEKHDISMLDLKSIITHGKEGAAYGSAVTTKGESIDLAWFIEFKSHKKDALIDQVTFFEVR